MNLIEKLGVEKCKQIVDGAHYPIVGYCLSGNNWIHKQCESAPTKYSNEANSWSEDYAINFVSIDDFRTAIAKHEANQATSTCKNCGNCENKAKSVLAVKQIESDDCSDIRNHVSPLTEVIEG